MPRTINIQDVFLNQLRKDKIPVTIFLMKGVPMKGTIRGFDAFMVILDVANKQEMIFKHAISTIIPTKNIQLMVDEQDD